jgi:hypothetical protein
MSYTSKLTDLLPLSMRRRVEPILELFEIMKSVKNVNTVAGMMPSVLRGFLLRQGRQEDVTRMVSGHEATFDWSYNFDHPELRELYTRAKQNQWDADVALDWSTDVDPLNPEVPLIPKDFLDLPSLSARFRLSSKEQMQLQHSVTSWMLSQFLHGEQGALYAAAQVTESVQWMDGKLYGSTQVMDEGRHVEVFHRYLDEKLNKLYVINDNLFVIVDSLITDSRWDMKFLGMQIMVEGLALGAFGTLYRMTAEPLLQNLLRYVIQDEARHVHYGVLALREHFTKHITETERREREDWSFEVALLMRNRFMLHEVYEEWFEGRMPRREWNAFVSGSPGMREFRQVMFSRLVPNLDYIGLLSPRIQQHYADAGLMRFVGGLNASELTAEQMIRDLDQGRAAPVAASIPDPEQASAHDHDHGHDHEEMVALH